jgi:anti-sigma B factor antagonist
MLAVEPTAQGARVSGVLDVRAAGRVREVLSDLLESTGGDVVLDVSGLDSLDVTGLAVLVAAHQRALRQDRRLVLAGVGPSLARLLAVTRLHRVLVVTRAA